MNDGNFELLSQGRDRRAVCSGGFAAAALTRWLRSMVGLALLMLFVMPGWLGAQGIIAEGLDPDEPVELTVTGPVDAIVPILEVLTGKKVLRSISLGQAEIHFAGEQPMPRFEAVLVLESLLSLNGIAVISMGDYLKLVPSSNLQNQAPDMLEKSTLGMYPSLRYYQKLFRFSYLNVDQEAMPLVNPLMSDPSQAIVYTKDNAVLLTDTLVNLQRVERILTEADKPSTAASEIFFFELKNVEASEMASQVQALILNDSPLAAPFTSNTVITADERTNKLIVITHPSNESAIEAIIRSLDEDVDPGTRVQAFYLKHAVASEVQPILDSLIQGQKQSSDSARGSGAPARQRTVTVEGGSQQVEAVVEVGSAGESGAITFSEFVNVVADERSNAIFASGTRADIRILGELIEKIDVLLPQVRIEVVIADVQLSENQSSGLSAFDLNLGPEGIVEFGSLTFGALGPTNLDIPTDGGLDGIDLATRVDLSRSNSNVDILASPVILTTHNKEGVIIVSEQRPLISGTTSTGDNITSSVDYRDVGIELTVKPLIGSSGLVQLEINQKSDSFGESDDVTVNGTRQFPINRREARSFVSMQSGQTIVLGGLRSRETRNTDGRLFVLGDLPIIGPLFQPETDRANETELLIFIRPTVLATKDDVDRSTSQTLDALGETGEVIREYYDSGDFPAAELPPYDPLKIKEMLGVSDEPGADRPLETDNRLRPVGPRRN